jgi:hypothetical protein
VQGIRGHLPAERAHRVQQLLLRLPACLITRSAGWRLPKRCRAEMRFFGCWLGWMRVPGAESPAADAMRWAGLRIDTRTLAGDVITGGLFCMTIEAGMDVCRKIWVSDSSDNRGGYLTW